MATASGPKAVRPAGATVSAPARHTPTQKVTPVPVPKPGSVPSLPPSANQAVAVEKASNAASNSATATAVQGGFGLLTPAESNLQDATNGPHRDGRIRNPVPSKLKGKTDGSKGNFSVMHMGVAGRAEPTERDAQAKRTSESTELAAKRAFENGYVSHRRSKFVQLSDDTVAKPFVPATTTAQVPSYMSARQTPLNADETKSEQARLLTLLRSLQPLLVVDQICKALAFFGGIPGAPPPANGEFPQSAEANGSGSLFVGWIAEIFPKLGGNNGQQNMAPVRQMDGPEPVRRKRGRPKGSKATKVRKDKGLKKGPSKDTPDRTQREADADGNWVDVEYGDTSAPDAVDANVMLLAQAASPHREPAHVEAPGITQPDAATSHVTATIPARTMQHHGPGTEGLVTESPGNMKKRGRPKGSRNRPKMSDASVLPRQSVQPADNSYASAQLSQATEGSQPQSTNASFTAVNSVASANSAKKKASRPKASATKKQVDGPVGTDSSGPTLQTTVPSAAKQQQTVELNGNPTQKQVQQNVHSDQGLQVIPVGTVPAPTTKDSARVPASVGQKRKRKIAKDFGAIDSINGTGSTTPSSTAVTLPTPSTQPGFQSATAIAAVGIPPAKRQRKSKESRPKGKKSNDMTIPDSSEPAASSKMKAAASAPVPSLNQAPATTPATFHMAHGIGSEVTPVSSSVSLEQVMPLAQSPQGHFDVQSPTMENYEAQLQAQLELKSDAESQHHSLAPRPIVTNHLQQQQSQQRQQRQQPTQQQTRQPSQTHTQLPCHTHSLTLNLNHQYSNPSHSDRNQFHSNHRSITPLFHSQQQNKANHHYTQYRPSTSPYSQGQHQHNYSSPQQQSQNFTGQQQAQATPQPTPAQQYSNTHQLPPYGSGQQSYQNSHSHYNGTQQSVASQQRYQQHLATGSVVSAICGFDVPN
ncbi:unnamed protein product [Sordaria macrospora k-hell]|uniref:WGS project CABT00000000 data, contig 2.58 n=1 Tax=Sordaria macrospora (strain ATCC MYA-333 / DSM 997 / K(L3346) / K-hell) TaxID=771870 RepID=F7WA54_SORMK|nr:uncharacterized protein SMAC_08458 [Sordaria macrospora k-hell]CCC14117.1 unnamed protein product [Sordaria macrospora k-hell]